VGPLPTVILAFGLFNSFLKDNESESTPEPVALAKDVGVSAATGGNPASTAVKRV